MSITVTGESGTSNPATWINVDVPAITSVVPIAGPIAGSNSVTITDSRFTGPLTARFGSTATFFTVASTSQLTAAAPARTGTVQVTVIGSGGTSSGVAYTYATVPMLTTVSPSSGPEAAGTAVVLTGTNLPGTTGVSVGGPPAASFTVDSSTQITAVSPAGTGTVQITTTTAGGVSNGTAYTYS